MRRQYVCDKAQLERLGHVDEHSIYLDLHGMKDGHGVDVIWRWQSVGGVEPRSPSGPSHLEAARVTTDPDGGKRGFGATKPGT